MNYTFTDVLVVKSCASNPITYYYYEDYYYITSEFVANLKKNCYHCVHERAVERPCLGPLFYYDVPTYLREKCSVQTAFKLVA